MLEQGSLPQRESIHVDVVIVGAGPAGLAAAIRLKQVNSALQVVVLEKGAEVGAHILSGAVVDPIGIDRLLPAWRSEPDHPFRTPVRKDRFLLMSRRRAFALPEFLLPPALRNHGNFIVSLGDVCRWLARHAEALGVDIFPGFAASELLYGAEGAVIGVATGDRGIGRNGKPGPNFQRGMELHAKYVLLAEGARGSLTKQAIARFNLDAESDVPKFGLGIKELWEVPAQNHHPGLVQHSLGWPLDNATGGGSFLYHLESNRVAIGFVVHLDYRNPYISPFEEFQRFKTHPSIRPVLEGGKRLLYGARAIAEGGWQSVPKLSFPGGALLGCAAGLVNVPRIKGSHNAVLSGMLAAESVASALMEGRQNDELVDIDRAWRDSAIGLDLKSARNVKPLLSRFGTLAGMALAGLDMWVQALLRVSPFGTLRHSKADGDALEWASRHRPIAYPKPDNVVSFDRLSSVFLSNTSHSEDQVPHLQVADAALQRRSEHDIYAGPSARYCPAGVYEWIEKEGMPYYQINPQNCVHCKTCDIKDPNCNITWVPPEGGEGPLYTQM